MAFAPKGATLTRDDLTGLFNEYYSRLFNYLYYRTLNRAVSEDLVSQVMLNIVRHYESYDGNKGNLDQWVFRIARNTFFSYLRQHKEETDIEAVPQNFVAYDDEGLDAIGDEGIQIREYLKVLDDDERELVYLKYWEELSNKEIGARLNMNPSTVSTKLWRATEKMRKIRPTDQ